MTSFGGQIPPSEPGSQSPGDVTENGLTQAGNSTGIDSKFFAASPVDENTQPATHRLTPGQHSGEQHHYHPGQGAYLAPNSSPQIPPGPSNQQARNLQQVPGLRLFTQLPQMLHMGIHFATMFVATLATAVVVMALLASAISSATTSSGISESADGIGLSSDMLAGIGQSFAFALGYLFSGQMLIDLHANVLFVTLNGDGNITLLTLGALAGLATLIALVGIILEQRQPTATWLERVLAACAPGLLCSMLVMLIASFGAIDITTQQVSLSVSPISPFMYCHILVYFATWAFFGRAMATLGRKQSTTWLNPIPAVWRSRGRAPWWVREPLTWWVTVAAVFAPAAVITLFVIAARGESAGAFSTALAAIGQVFFAVIALGHFIPISTTGESMSPYSTSSSTDETYWTFHPDYTVLWGTPLLAMLALVYSALWIGVERRRAPFSILRSIVLVTTPVITWLAIVIPVTHMAFTLSISASGTSAVDTEFHAFIPWWSPIIILLWSLVLEGLSHLLPNLLFSISPKAMAALVGRQRASDWYEGVSALQNSQQAQTRYEPAASQPSPMPAPSALHNSYGQIAPDAPSGTPPHVPTAPQSATFAHPPMTPPTNPNAEESRA